jgi:hypothetical protein
VKICVSHDSRVNTCVNPYINNWDSRHHCIIEFRGKTCSNARHFFLFRRIFRNMRYPTTFLHIAIRIQPGPETCCKTLISGLFDTRYFRNPTTSVTWLRTKIWKFVLPFHSITRHAGILLASIVDTTE